MLSVNAFPLHMRIAIITSNNLLLLFFCFNKKIEMKTEANCEPLQHNNLLRTKLWRCAFQ